MGTKTIQMERKNHTGFVIEQIGRSISIVVSRKSNGRIFVKLNVPDDGSVNVYRIDVNGCPENKHTKECAGDQPKKKSGPRLNEHTSIGA